MNRRAYLSTVTAASGAFLLSGCTQSSPEGGQEQSSTQGETDSEKAATHMETAGKALQNAGQEISNESDKFTESEFSNGGVDFKPSTITSYLDKASQELETAEKFATDSQQERITAARDYIEFARKTTEFLDVLAEGYTITNSGLTYFQSERYQDAATELKTAKQKLGTADDHLSIVQDRSTQINTSSLDDFDQVEVEAIQTDISTLDELLPPLKALAGGLRQMALGMIDFETANTHLENNEYRKAQTACEKAADHFTTSESTFKEQEGTAPSSVKSSFIELTCYAEALKNGSKDLASAAEALANGNDSRAQTKSEAAKEAFNSCNFDS